MRTGQVWFAPNGDVYLFVRQSRLNSYREAYAHHVLKLVSGERCTLVEPHEGHLETKAEWERVS